MSSKRRTKRKFHIRKTKKRDEVILAIFMVIFGILAVYLIYFAIYFALLISLNIHTENEFFIEILIVIISIGTSYGLINKVFNYFREKLSVVKWWNSKIALTIGLMILFYSVGHISLVYFFGAPDKISLVLRNSENIDEVLGNITCQDNSGKLLAGNEILCEIKPDLSNLSSNVSFTLYDGSKITNDFSQKRFIAIKDSYYVYFKIIGIDKNNQTLKMEVGYPVRFFTKEENDKRSEQYFYYFIILLGVVLFSVPSMMNNFDNLVKKKVTRYRKRK